MSKSFITANLAAASYIVSIFLLVNSKSLACTQGFTSLTSQLSFAIKAKMGYGKLLPFSKPPQSPHPIADSDSQADESIIFMCVLHKKFPSTAIIFSIYVIVNLFFLTFYKNKVKIRDR